MQQERQRGNAESFSRKSGTLMSKQFIPIGEVKSLKIQVVARYRQNNLSFIFVFIKEIKI